MCKENIFCKSCRTKIGTVENDTFIFSEMKQISKLEMQKEKFLLKCRNCNCWNEFKNNTQEINHKKRSEEIFYKN